MTRQSASDSDGDSDDKCHLYGAPQHEVTDDAPDETLYGTPQHETSESLDDFELLCLEVPQFDPSTTLWSSEGEA